MKLLVVTILIIELASSCALAEEVYPVREPQKTQMNFSNEVNLEEIVVTNRRSASFLGEASENITVFYEDEIRQLPARDLGEVLRCISGVDVPPRQGFGRATSLSIQGSDSRQVRVMVDGIPLNSQSSGQFNPAMLPVENIDRIEIVKGASSSLWGSSLGGVINVITKNTGTTIIPKGSLETSFAEFRTTKQNGEVSGKAGNFGYYLFSSYMESGGRLARNDVLEKKGFGKFSYDLKDAGNLIASFGYSQADANSGMMPDGTWQAQPYKLPYGKIGWDGNIRGADVRIDFKHSRAGNTTKYLPSETDTEPFLEINNKESHSQLSTGVTFHLREEDSLVLGSDLDWDVLKSDVYITEAKSLQLQAPYANYTLKLMPWDFNFGLRYDNNSEFGNDLSPSLGAVYHLKQIPETLIRAGVSHAFNAPPLLWKYNSSDNPFLMTAPNADIKPEYAWVYEAGIESRPIPKFWFKFSAYHSDVWDALASASTGTGLTYMKNFKKFTRQGAELQCKLNIFKGLDLVTSEEFNHIVDTSTKKIVQGGGKARRSFSTGLEYKNTKGFGASLKNYYIFWNEPDSSQANDKKMILDLKLSQGFKPFSIFLSIHNLTNTKYWQDYSFPSLPRYFEGGVKIEW